jgi:hypothetical protein
VLQRTDRPGATSDADPRRGCNQSVLCPAHVQSIAASVALVVAVMSVLGSDAHASPAAPMGLDYDSALTEGQWKLSYSYQRFDRKGLRRGTHKEKASDAATADLTQIPTELRTDVHTIEIHHAPFERLTVAIKIPVINHKMKQRDFPAGGGAGGDRYNTESSGVGDIEVVGVIPFMEKGEEKLDVHLGLRFPSGEISERDDVPDGAGGVARELLPRSMQTGSRTVAVVTGFSYRGDWEGLGWGVHGTGSIGFGENHRDYRAGNQMEFAGWLAHDVTSWLSGSFRLGFDYQMRSRGKRQAGPVDHLDSFRNTTEHKVLEVAPGVSVGVPGFEGQRVRFEAAWPVYQDANATQIDRDWNLIAGWDWVF